MTLTRSPWPLLPLLAATLLVGVPSPARSEAPDPTPARWIWGNDPAFRLEGPLCYLRRRFTLPSPPNEAEVLITADNGFGLFVNNTLVAEECSFGGTWGVLKRFRIDPLLVRGPNVLAVRGENLGGPAGVLVALAVTMEGGEILRLVSDASWKASPEASGNWTGPDHDDTTWPQAVEVVPYGGAPWGRPPVPAGLSDPASLVVDRSGPGGFLPMMADTFTEPPADYDWPTAIVYVAGRAPDSSTAAQTVLWPIRGSRAFFENDTPAPSCSGHRLELLAPARPGVEPRVLLDAGTGLIGSPSVSWDGSEVLFSMARAGDKRFHIWRIAADGSDLTQLTDGLWHDYDPAELPDGRIVFSSTRLGCREEYHANTARSLFTLDRATGVVRPLTQHIVADVDPEVLADGRVAFVRQDNFLERAKVETQIHCVYPDGTRGVTLLGADRGAATLDRAYAAEEDMAWLRALGFGSPAALPDGGVAAISHLGLTVTGPSLQSGEKHALACDVQPFDLAPTPDGRLLASTTRGDLTLLDLATGKATRIREGGPDRAHSPAWLGPRPRPRVLPGGITPAAEENQQPGVLLCQSVFETRQRNADWRRVVAVRVIAGEPTTIRAAHHQYGHVGTVGMELGTVPLAPDGSFQVRVPSDRPLFLQAVDAEGRAVVSEMSWTYVRPGETRSCVGCHAPSGRPPLGSLPLASARPPVDLSSVRGALRFRANNAANGGIVNLQTDRFRENASINAYSGEGAEALRTGSPLLRRRAAERLGLLREPSASAALIEALSDRSEDVRRASALALAACGGREACEPLARALADPSSLVSRAAWLALEHIAGGAPAFDSWAPLAERRRASEAVRAWAASLDWSAREAELVARLASADPTDRHLAAEALGRIGGREAAGSLRARLAEEAETDLRARLACVRALGHVGSPEDVPELRRLLLANLGEVPNATGKSHELGWQAAPDFLAGAAAESLGRIGGPEAESALLEGFRALREFWFYSYRTADHEWLMGCQTSIPHHRILEALDRLAVSLPPELAGAVVRSLPIDGDRGLLNEEDDYEALVARLLARSGLSDAIAGACLEVLGGGGESPDPLLTEAVSASPPAVSVAPLTPAGRAAQVLALVATSSSPAMRAALARWWATEPSPERSWVCFHLARGLGRLADREAVDLLLQILASPPEGADGVPDPPNVFLYGGWSPTPRAAAAGALGRIGDPRAFDALAACVREHSNAMDTRSSAARSLTQLAPLAGRGAEVADLARDYPEPTTRRILLSGPD